MRDEKTWEILGLGTLLSEDKQYACLMVRMLLLAETVGALNMQTQTQNMCHEHALHYFGCRQWHMCAGPPPDKRNAWLYRESGANG